jgi:hypothetical protein
MAIQSVVHRYIVPKTAEDQLVIEELHKKYAEEISSRLKVDRIIIPSMSRYQRGIYQLSEKAQSYLIKQKNHKTSDLIEVVINRALIKRNLQECLKCQIRMHFNSPQDVGTYGSMGTRTGSWIVITAIFKKTALKTSSTSVK